MARTTVSSDGFDVTCVVGRVTFAESGDAPELVAFRLILEHGAPGTFYFPADNGGEYRIDVPPVPETINPTRRKGGEGQ